jgi:hypothetical protein
MYTIVAISVLEKALTPFVFPYFAGSRTTTAKIIIGRPGSDATVDIPSANQTLHNQMSPSLTLLL